MNEIVESLALDLVEWLDCRLRTYADTIDAWRTSCPRLMVWEDALDAGLIAIVTEADGGMRVRPTEAGRTRLAARAIRLGNLLQGR